MSGWIDNHCHVHDPNIPGGPDGAIAAARAAGVTAMITVGCDAATTQAALDLAARFADVWASVGLHPHDAKDGVATITPFLDRPRVVAIGECGLDYYYDHSPRDVQRAAFAEQIQIAHERDLPLIIHTRDAWADTFDVLAAEGVPTRTIFHCFSGGSEEARRCLDLGAFLSFSGIVTFPNAADVQDAAKLCPLERMLVETDSPYLAPVPVRGRKNEPANVVHVGTFIAGLRDLAADDVAAATSTAACLAFPGLAP
jgi:TatD DNase family protein